MHWELTKELSRHLLEGTLQQGLIKVVDWETPNPVYTIKFNTIRFERVTSDSYQIVLLYDNIPIQKLSEDVVLLEGNTATVSGNFCGEITGFVNAKY